MNPTNPPPAPCGVPAVTAEELAKTVKYSIHGSIADASVLHVMLKDAERDMMEWILDTREKVIHEGLVKLGWTPPDQNKDAAIAAVLEALLNNQQYLLRIRDLAAKIANGAPDENERFVGRQLILVSSQALEHFNKVEKARQQLRTLSAGGATGARREEK